MRREGGGSEKGGRKGGKGGRGRKERTRGKEEVAGRARKRYQIS